MRLTLMAIIMLAGMVSLAGNVMAEQYPNPYQCSDGDCE
jgi:hypothetical protein